MNQYTFRSDSVELAFPGEDVEAAIAQLIQLFHPDTYYRGRGTVTLVNDDVSHTFLIEES